MADSRSKRQPSDSALREAAIQKYTAAAELLQCAVNPTNTRVPPRTKASLQSKLQAVEMHLGKLQQRGATAGATVPSSDGAPSPSSGSTFVADTTAVPTPGKLPDAAGTHGAFGTRTGTSRGPVDDDDLFATPRNQERPGTKTSLAEGASSGTSGGQCALSAPSCP